MESAKLYISRGCPTGFLLRQKLMDSDSYRKKLYISGRCPTGSAKLYDDRPGNTGERKPAIGL